MTSNDAIVVGLLLCSATAAQQLALNIVDPRTYRRRRASSRNSLDCHLTAQYLRKNQKSVWSLLKLHNWEIDGCCGTNFTIVPAFVEHHLQIDFITLKDTASADIISYSQKLTNIKLTIALNFHPNLSARHASNTLDSKRAQTRSDSPARSTAWRACVILHSNFVQES